MSEPLEVLLARAVEHVKAMTPEQKSEMLRKQAESWVRAEAGLDEGTRPFPAPTPPEEQAALTARPDEAG
jgi:hypothetical protein